MNDTHAYTGSIPVSTTDKVAARLVEDTVLKTATVHTVRGSTPLATASTPIRTNGGVVCDMLMRSVALTKGI